MTTYYGQHGEDGLLLEFFKNQSTGVYVDVGAFDGKHLSNTYLFDKRGWSGVCVEPDKKFFKMCKNIRTAECVNVACVGDPTLKEVPFMSVNQNVISSRMKTCMDKLRPGNKKKLTFTETTAKAMTLNQILQNTIENETLIDLLSIDVEGEELNILRNFDFNRYAPRILVMEANTEKEKQESTTLMVDTVGYVYAGAIGVNLFFAASNEDAERLKTINVKCHIKTQHPCDENSRSNRDRILRVKLE